MKKKIALCLFVITLLSMSFLVGCGNKKPTADTTAPIITAQNVPTSGLNGRSVIVPSATVADDVDGDLSSKVKLTVTQLKEDGTPKKELLYQVAGNIANTFTPSGNLYKYTIVFSVKDSAGNKAEKTIEFVATPDSEAPELTLNLAGFDGFDTNVGIVGKKATQGISIPKATAIDKPGDVDISELITVSIINDDTEEYAKTFYNINEIGEFRLLKGNYTAVYSVSDLSGNAATDMSFPIIVDRLSDGENLMLDPLNFATGFNSSRNVFGDVFLGMDAHALDNTVNCSCLSFNAAKLHDEIVAMRVKVDQFGADGGEMLYDFSYRGSKNNDFAEPTGKEGEWPPYFVLRADRNGMAMLASTSPTAYMKITKSYSSTIADGNEHTVYFQVVNEGATSDAADAKIVMKLWVDIAPTEAPVMVGEVVRGSETKEGVLVGSLFDTLWNAKGWLSFGAISNNKNQFNKYDDDGAILKGLTIYDKDATEFNVDLVAPTLAFSSEPALKYNINESVTFVRPSAISDGVDVSSNIKVYLIDALGNKGENVTGAITISNKGNYTLVYEVSDANKNKQYQTFAIKFIVANNIAPVITVSKTAINVTIGQEFTLPTYSATDDLEGDLTSQVVVDIEGAQKAKYINFGGKNTFTIFALGTHELVFKVSDMSDNVAEERVVVNVTGEKIGNVLSSDTANLAGTASVDTTEKTVSIGNEKYISYNGQQVYDKKVSTIINATNGKLFMINVHGANNNNGIWLDGMTLSFASNDTIYLSLKGYNDYIVGSASKMNPFTKEWYQNIDVRVEFQTSFVTEDGVDYMAFELWINETAIQFTAEANKSILSGTKILVAINNIPHKFNNALGAGFFFIGCQEQSLTLKELRIDGSSCALPAAPVIPEGYEYPTFGASAVVGDLTNVKAVKDQTATVISTSNQDKIYLKLKFGASSGIYSMQLTNSASDNPWGSNSLMFIFKNGNLFMGTSNNYLPLYIPFPLEYGGEYYLTYQLTYIKNEHDLFSGLKVEAWTAVKTDDTWDYKKATWAKDGTPELEVGADMLAPVLPYKMFGGKANIEPSALVIGAMFTDAATIAVLEAGVNTALEITEWVKPGITYPTLPQTVTPSEDFSITTPEGFNTMATSSPIDKMVYFTINASVADGGTAAAQSMFLQLVGGQKDVWPKGIVIELKADGNIFFHLDSNASWHSVASYNYALATDMKFAYKISYVLTEGYVTALNVDLYQHDGTDYKKIVWSNNSNPDCVFEGNLVIPQKYLSDVIIAPNAAVFSVANSNDKMTIAVKDISIETAAQ